MKDKFLPIGTLVLLKDAEKKLMITGYCSALPEEPDKVYDYVGCLFPEGNLAGPEVALFDHNQIDKVIYMGYMDLEFKNFEDKVKELIAEDISVQKKEIKSLDDCALGNPANLPPLTPENIKKLLNQIKNNGDFQPVPEPTGFSPEVTNRELFPKKEEKKEEEKKATFSVGEDISVNDVKEEAIEKAEEKVADGTPVLKLELIGETPQIPTGSGTSEGTTTPSAT